jgi:hypothetical protein
MAAFGRLLLVKLLALTPINKLKANGRVGLKSPFFVGQNTRSFSVIDVRQFSAILHRR